MSSHAHATSNHIKANGKAKLVEAAAHRPAADTDARAQRIRRKRRFGRTGEAKVVEHPAAAESIAAMRAEVVLLREENARLKTAPHQGPDLGKVLGRARSLPTADFERDNVADEAAQLLVEGLVIRESLLEVCHEIERSMVALEARLNALVPSPDDPSEITAAHLSAAHADREDTESHGPGV